MGMSLVLNHSSYIKRLQDDHIIRSILQLHGIKYVPTQQSTDPFFVQQRDHQYLIPVFQMDALAIYRLDEEGGLSFTRAHQHTRKLHEMIVDKKTNLLRRLERYAIHAVYTLGLDYACVYVQVQRSGNAVIQRIDVNPIQCGQVLERYVEAIRALGHRREAKPSDNNSVVFGMDPEFLLRSEQGKIVPASRFFPAKGSVGYDSATVLGRKDIHPLVELRPEPSDDLLTLVHNLRKTMWAAAKQINDNSIQWIAGGMPIRGLPLGGHIHMSGICLSSQLIRALDNYLALPLIMMEDTSTRERRKKYGRLGDIRRPTHGGFEYRTLPSWIISPRLTKGVLVLTRIIVQHYEELVDRPLDRQDILTAYIEGDKQALEPIVQRLWHQLETTAEYKRYIKYVEPLKNWVMKQRIWNEQADIRAAWRIPPFH